MASSSSRRRVATVLFVDIVGSTRLASDLGDAGWRHILARFRRVVRAELKRWRGREQDTAGDGFYATFGEPAQALRAAASIVAAVQTLGLDLRVGLHTGECEQVDGKLTGIAVHIGARVMAVARAAEVLVTRTTRDLVVGSDAGFEEAGTHELKGVEGTWLLYRLVSVAEPLPGPLDPDVAARRLAEIAGDRRRRRRWPLVAAAAAIAVSIGAVLAFGAFGSSTKPPAHRATASLLRLDPKSGRVVATVRDAQIGCGCGANLWAIDGTLWERGGNQGQLFASRKLSNGSLVRVFHAPADMADFAAGSGSLWIVRNTTTTSGPNLGAQHSWLDRLDELSGRRTGQIRLPGSFGQGALAVGEGAVWALEDDPDGTLLRIDPLTMRVTGRFETGALETSILVPADGYLWVCECLYHKVLRFDPRTKVAKTFNFTQQPWYLVSVAENTRPTLWLLDSRDATITRLNPATGRAGSPLGLAGDPTEAVIARGSIWVAAGKIVDRVVLSSGARTAIQLPKGTHATGIAVDPVSDAIWVDNSRTEDGA
jgi:class 3 adenylate cyclase/streptogramin lyase